MRSLFTTRHITIALSAALVAGLALSGAAYAIGSAAFRYTTPQTGYLMVPPAAFEAESNTAAYANGGMFVGGNGADCFYAPANLPHGAKLTQFMMWYYKEDGNAAHIKLRRLQPSANSVDTIATLIPANVGNTLTQAAVGIANPSLRTVNNARYFYFVELCPSNTEIFSGARIKYTYKTAGD